MCIEAGLVVAMTGQGREVNLAAHLLEFPHTGEVCHGQDRELGRNCPAISPPSQGT
jgi:hypothetical protein